MKDLNYNSIIVQQVASLDISINKAQQVKIIEQIIQSGKVGQEALLNFLVDRCIIQKKNVEVLDGLIFEFLYFHSIDDIKKRLSSYFSCGLIDFKSSLQLKYQPLQDLLINHNFQQADKLTQFYLCSLANLDQKYNRKWLYFTDMLSLPSEDLYILDKLWRVYSRDKFGFSIQRKIWLSINCNWEKFWVHIGWNKNGIPVRYPSEFTWNINAPEGHLPLLNQLRGVQVIAALFNHNVWSDDELV
uniref:Ycf53 n=1 Tax=Gracilaria hainanensis TaxID=2871843 RepID=A0AAU7YNV8_9FLOR